jgi:hypothetical protein
LPARQLRSQAYLAAGERLSHAGRLGVSVSNPTPVVSVTLCDANDRAEFDGLSRQKPEMKEDLHHS